MKADEIKKLIKEDSEYALGALMRLYEFQEPVEQNGKATTSKNQCGFNKVDAGILSDLAQFYLKKGFLTKNQIALLSPKLQKYASQLADVGFDKIEMKAKTEQKSTEKKKPQEKIAKDHNETTIQLKFEFDREVIEKIKTINGRVYHKEDKSWTVPKTLVNMDKLLELGFKLDESLQNWYDAQNEGVTDDIDIPGLNDTLMDFQKRAVSYIDSRGGRALIADQMGLGKTLESIAWIQYRGKEVLPALIVCPAAVKLNWEREFYKFTDFGDKVEILSGKTPYKPSKPICIINYDIINDWKSYIISSMKPKTIISDEVHFCKNRNANRTKGVKYIAKYAKNFIGLTGTPILNRPVEIYEPLSMIKPTLFPNFKAFAYRYCDPKHNGWGMDFNGAANTVELHQVLNRELLLKRNKEDVLKELPPKTRSIVPLEIDNKKEYKKAEDDLINYLKEIDTERAKRAERAEMLIKINTLKQLAIKGKIKQAKDWLADFAENEKLVVFVHHKDTVEQLMEHFNKSAVKIVGGMTHKKRQESEDKFWNDSNIRLLIGNIDAAGTGLNLQISSNPVFLEYPWSPGLYSQAEDRCHRKGQENAVISWNLIANNTIEESMVKMLDEKSQIISEVVDGNQSEDNSGMFNALIDSLGNK